MGNDPYDYVGVVSDYKIKAPILGDAGLPEVLRFIKLLSLQAWIAEILL